MRPRLRLLAPCAWLAALGALTLISPVEAQGKKANPAATPISREKETDKNGKRVAWDRHRTILAHLAKVKGDVDLVFLGDSITQQWGGNGQKNTGVSIWNKRYEPIKAANLGVGADQTGHALWRITKGGELKGLKPKLVVLLMGINNAAGPQSAEQIAEGHAAIIKAIQANNAATKVLLVSTFPARSPGDPIRKKVKKLNELLARQADGDRVRWLDIHDRFLDAKGNVTDAMGSKDKLHLTLKGYQIWADAIQPTIDAVVGKPPAPPGQRTRWVHADGEVVAKGKGTWVEKQKTGQFTFVEKSSTAEYVELYDKSRDYTVRLTATAMLIKGGKGTLPKFADFTRIRDGRWVNGG